MQPDLEALDPRPQPDDWILDQVDPADQPQVTRIVRPPPPPVSLEDLLGFGDEPEAEAPPNDPTRELVCEVPCGSLSYSSVRFYPRRLLDGVNNVNNAFTYKSLFTHVRRFYAGNQVPLRTLHSITRNTIRCLLRTSPPVLTRAGYWGYCRTSAHPYNLWGDWGQEVSPEEL